MHKYKREENEQKNTATMRIRMRRFSETKRDYDPVPPLAKVTARSNQTHVSRVSRHQSKTKPKLRNKKPKEMSPWPIPLSDKRVSTNDISHPVSSPRFLNNSILTIHQSLKEPSENAMASIDVRGSRQANRSLSRLDAKTSMQQRATHRIPANDRTQETLFQNNTRHGSLTNRAGDTGLAPTPLSDPSGRLVKQKKIRKTPKNLRSCCCRCSLFRLLFFLLGPLLLGILLAVLLVAFVPKSSTTKATESTRKATSTTSATTVTTTTTTQTTSTQTTTTQTTATTTSTTTSRPTGALSIYANVTASYFEPGGGTVTAQSDGVTDRQPTGSAFLSNYAPQYIQLELPGEYNITNVCLLICQTPAGLTSHLLFVGPWSNSTQLVSNVTGATSNGQWLNLTYSPPLNDVRFLYLSTVISPSWVCWEKFLVYGV